MGFYRKMDKTVYSTYTAIKVYIPRKEIVSVLFSYCFLRYERRFSKF